MTARTAARFAWTIWAVSIVLAAIGAWLNMVNAQTSSGVLAIHLFLVPGYATIGAIVASRTGNRIGWLFLAVGLASAGTAFAFEYSVRAVGTAPGSLPFGPHMGAISNIAFPVTFMWIGGLLLLFPDGHLPSRRWRPIAWAFLLTWSVIAVTSLIDPHGITEGDFHFTNPFGIPFARSLPFLPFENGTATGLWSLAAWGSLIAITTAPFSRRRHAAEEGRKQLTWIAAAIVFTLASALIAAAATALAPDVGSWLAVVPLAMVALGIPVAVGVAILKFRLYEIDVVIKKTVIFATVVVAVTAFYVIVAVVLPTAVFGLGGSVSPTIAALVGIAIGLLIIPTRNRARRFADRLVYGKRATPYEVLEEFSGRMSEVYATEDVLPRMARILGEAVGAARAQVWLRLGDELRPAGRWPTDATTLGPVRLVDGAVHALPPDGSATPPPTCHLGSRMLLLETWVHLPAVERKMP